MLTKIVLFFKWDVLGTVSGRYCVASIEISAHSHLRGIVRLDCVVRHCSLVMSIKLIIITSLFSIPVI